MDMQAAVLWEVPGELKMETVTLADPGPNDVLVQIVGSGVCGSEIHLLDGDFPHFPTPVIPGHEAAGIVIETGADVTTVSPGDHVVLGWIPGCGRCRSCWNGDVRRCLNPASGGLLIDGRPRLSIGAQTIHHFAHIAGFAEYAVVLERTCIKIRDDAPLEKVCLIGCGVATGYGAVFYNAKVTPGSSAVVIGCGGVGLNVIQSLDLALATTIIAVDINDFKLEKAKIFGATHTINSSRIDPVEAVREITGGTGADFGFEVITTDRTVEQCIDATRAGGTVTVVGAPKPGMSITVPASPGRILQSGGPGGTQWTVTPLLVDLYMLGKVKLDELISKERPLSEVNEAIFDLRAGEVARTVLLPQS